MKIFVFTQPKIKKLLIISPSVLTCVSTKNGTIMAV